MGRDLSRRRYLGVVGTAAAFGLAGCSSDRSADSSSPENPPETKPAPSGGTPNAESTSTSEGPSRVGDGTATASSTPTPQATAEPTPDVSAIADATAATGPARGSPQYRYDPRNSGFAGGETGPNGPVTERWSVEMDRKVRWAPAVADGTVYVGSDRFYALDAADGTERWTFEELSTFEGTPTVADGVVYVGSTSGGGPHVHALDTGDGTERWNFTADDWVIASPVVVDGTVYIGSFDNHVYALDATSGEEQWSFDTGRRIYGSPAVADGIVYVVNDRGTVYALDSATGQKQWSASMGSGRSSSQSLTVSDGTVYAAGSDTLYALDGTDGSERWTFEAGVYLSPAVVNGYAFVHSGVHEARVSLYALETSSGEVQWSADVELVVGASPPVVADGVVYAVGRADEVGSKFRAVAFDATDGAQSWSHQFGVPGGSSPVVVDGTVYVGSEYGIHALAEA